MKLVFAFSLILLTSVAVADDLSKCAELLDDNGGRSIKNVCPGERELITAYCVENDQNECACGGSNHCLLKPLRPGNYQPVKWNRYPGKVHWAACSYPDRPLWTNWETGDVSCP